MLDKKPPSQPAYESPVIGGLSISEAEFQRIREIMYRKSGVYLLSTKKPLVITRLRRRLIDMGLKSFTEYVALLERPGSAEAEVFVNAITTNETFFYRHDNQFNFLVNKTIPEILASRPGQREIRIWSAASSSGEEPYTLALVTHEYQKAHPGVTFSIMATDINTDVLNEARAGVYSEKSVKLVPKDELHRYFQEIPAQGTYSRPEYAIKPEIKRLVTFKQHNFMEMPPVRNVDIIFLRNALIYFDKESKQKAVDSISRASTERGFLFVSLSETLNDVKSQFKFIAHGVYRRQSPAVDAQGAAQ